MTVDTVQHAAGEAAVAEVSQAFFDPARRIFDNLVICGYRRSRLGKSLPSKETPDAVPEPPPTSEISRAPRRFLLTSAPPRSPRASPSPSAQILTHGLPARPDHEALDGRTCTLAAAILLLRRYTERHDFTARVYDNPPSGAAPTDPSSRFVATGCDCVDVGVSFDDDATVANVLVQCKRAIAEVGTTLTTTPDVLIATLRPGRDPEPVAAALLAELEHSCGGDGEKSSGSRFAFLFCERQGALAAVANAPARARHDIKRTAGHLNVLLAALGGPQTGPSLLRAPAWSVPICSAEETRRLRQWNAASDRPGYLPNPRPCPTHPGHLDRSGSKSFPSPRATTLPARIAEAAAASPNAIAVSTESKTGVVGADGADARGWTYRELTRVAATIASRLRRSIGRADIRGERVGVYLERGPYLVASLVAVHLTGAAYVPLDPLYPADRIGAMLTDARAAAVLTSVSGGLANEIGAIVEAARRQSENSDVFEPPVVSLADLEEEVDANEESCDFGALAAVARPDDLAYVIFTSGSTGRPKGVQVTHANFMNFIYSMEEITGADANVVLCAVTTVCFDIAGLELFLPLCVGGRTVLASRETAADPRALADLIAREDVNFMQATPTTWRTLIRSCGGGEAATGADPPGADPPGADPPLRRITALVGGEAVPAELAVDMINSTRVAFNVYGPTETTVWSTCAAISRSNPTSIGKPIANTSVYVAAVAVDDELNVRVEPAPVGVVGEICIGGAGVSRGYVGRDALTAERFPRDPFSDDPNARLYRTGDLGRLRPDTLELECLGRLDHQVKIRGYRVELGEIEAALEQLPTVEQAVVAVHDSAKAAGEEDARQLVAYVVEASSDDGSDDAAKADEDGRKKSHDSDLTKDLAEAEAWGAVYDEAYAARDALDESDPSLNFSGYGNSYTPGRVHRPEVVREWVETICERIAGLRPRRALELGCGNGMILLRIAKLCERYVGTDLSANAIDYVRDVITSHPDFILPHCELDIAGAHEAARFTDKHLDTVVCNGVSMYFPSADYLTSVVENSLTAVRPGGHFFLGDVRNFRLHRHFHASVQLFLADPGMTFHDYRINVATHVKHEKELLVDPVAFLAMVKRALSPSLCDRVVIDMRRGYHRTEFGMYRYDVVFRRPADATDAPKDGGARYDLEPWDSTVHSLAEIEDMLVGDAPEYLAFTGVPDARLVHEEALLNELEDTADAHAHATAGALRAHLDKVAVALERAAVEPEDVYRLGERLGYRVNAMWTPDEPTRFDVVFAKASAPEPEPVAFASLRHRGLDHLTVGGDCEDTAEMLRELTNKGARATASAEKALTDLVKRKGAAESEKPDAPVKTDEEDAAENSVFSIVPAAKARVLRVALRSSLPAYMIPRAVVGVKPGGLPMTSNGKIDRNALPAPATLRAKSSDIEVDAGIRSVDYVAPDGDAEELVSALFEEILFPEGSGQVGALDDFFDLGGHSLLAMQFTGRLEAATGFRLQMRQLNDAPTPRAVASALRNIGYDSNGANRGSSIDRTDIHSVDRRLSSSLPASAASSNALTVVDPVSLPHASAGTVRVDEIFFPTRDGTKLSARLWLPDGVALDADELRAPAVIEILPYGYATGTIDTDEATYPYLAGNGIACIRVDSRGSGNSEGVLDDEYSPQQQRDACDACEWAAAQPWCTGAVGMMGCSWGGFIALQVAALAGDTAGKGAAREAPSLRAVCAVCATDERASDDMHWMGGSLLGENLAWGAWLLDSLAAPPVPVTSSVGTASPGRISSGNITPYTADSDGDENHSDNDQSSWESRWVSRLEELKPMHGEWASLHPESSRGRSYWKEGSVGSGGRNMIAVPVLSVGCLHGGGYANSTPRLARALGPNRVKAVMGSWVHNYPHLSKSGPAFGFLAEVLDFWREHLFVPGNPLPGSPRENRRDVPGVRVHVQRPPLDGGPVTAPERAEGYWVAEHSQDHLDAAADEGAFLLAFTPEGTLEADPRSARRDELDIFSAPKVMRDTPERPVGVASGRWFTFGDGDDLPGDQRPDDERSVCFDGAPVTVETAIIGAPRITVACRRVGEDATTHSGVVVARVCAVAPDGSSHRITYGVCNVSAMSSSSHGSVSNYQGDEDESTFAVTVACDYCAFSIPVGWKLRVGLSQTYWPVIAPSPAGFEPLAVVGGACEIPALSDEHIADKWSYSVDTIPELEVLVAPLATRGLRGGEVRNDLIGAGASAKVIRRADSGARLVPLKDSRLIVESQAVDVSARSGRSQRIERRRVIKGLATSGKVSPKSALDSMHAFGPASPTSRSSTPGLVDAEIVVGAEMTVVDGAYKFDTKLEAFVTEENEDSDTENRRSVFARSWTEIAPAVVTQE